jgi:hypothetical protein
VLEEENQQLTKKLKESEEVRKMLETALKMEHERANQKPKGGLFSSLMNKNQQEDMLPPGLVKCTQGHPMRLQTEPKIRGPF